MVKFRPKSPLGHLFPLIVGQCIFPPTPSLMQPSCPSTMWSFCHPSMQNYCPWSMHQSCPTDYGKVGPRDFSAYTRPKSTFRPSVDQKVLFGLHLTKKTFWAKQQPKTAISASSTTFRPWQGRKPYFGQQLAENYLFGLHVADRVIVLHFFHSVL